MSTIRRNTVVSKLGDLRSAWEETGGDLLTIKAVPALMLLDVCCFLNLNEGEIEQVLGAELSQRVTQYVEAPINDTVLAPITETA